MVAMYIAAEDKTLLAKLRRNTFSYLPLSAGKIAVTRFDTLAIPIFLEFIYLIRFAVLTLRDGLLTPACDLFTFELIREKEEESKMNLIVLAIMVATKEYLDKIVLNLGSSTWVKGRDKLSA